MALKYSKRGVPLTRCCETLTEQAFFGWLRSALRRMSIRWKPKIKYLEAIREPNNTDNKRLKWVYRCQECAELVARKNLEVDHIIRCGSLTCFDDLPAFCARLFCEIDGYKALCIPCHLKKTNEER